ncbi:hypothetical protein AB4254_08340 [Vibrio breoganii]
MSPSKRINFTTESLEDLKITLTNTVNVLSTLMWLQIMTENTRNGWSLNKDENKLTSHITGETLDVKPMHPKRSELLNNCATTFGYKNWNELVTESHKRSADEVNTIFVHQEQRLTLELEILFTHYTTEHFKGLSESMGAILSIIVSAITLNPNAQLPDNEKLSFMCLDEHTQSLNKVGVFERLLPVLQTTSKDEVIKSVVETCHQLNYSVRDTNQALEALNNNILQPPTLGEYARKMTLGEEGEAHRQAGIVALMEVVTNTADWLETDYTNFSNICTHALREKDLLLFCSRVQLLAKH